MWTRPTTTIIAPVVRLLIGVQLPGGGISGWTGQIDTFSLRGVCGAPQRTWVDVIRVELEHAVVKLARALGLVVQPVKVPNVLAGGVCVGGGGLSPRGFVSREDRDGLHRRHLFHRRTTLASRLPALFLQ